jgi:hypothetical protein
MSRINKEIIPKFVFAQAQITITPGTELIEMSSVVTANTPLKNDS